jgi:hypothetical protein
VIDIGTSNNTSFAAGAFDPVLYAARDANLLDELRLTLQGSPWPMPLISKTALEDLLLHKKKWWRLALEGVGLDDTHCDVLATLFKRDDACKVGDLLSLKSNPAIHQSGYKAIFSVFFNKQRMGMIKVDNAAWEAKFDLVRSMNNLHGRLDYLQKGVFQSRATWVEWLAKLGSLGWEDDKHKLNYIWYTLRERPEFIR